MPNSPKKSNSLSEVVMAKVKALLAQRSGKKTKLSTGLGNPSTLQQLRNRGNVIDNVVAQAQKPLK